MTESEPYVEVISHVLEALLVENDDLDAEMLTSLAETDDPWVIHFTRARTLAEAYQASARQSFDIYFVDLCVGEGTSLKLLATLESAGARPVVVSNATPREVQLYGLNAGRCRFLPKSECSRSRLNAIFREALRARAERHAAIAG